MNRTSRRTVLVGAVHGVAAVVASACGAAQSTQPAGGTQKLTGSFELWQPWPIEQPTHGGPIGWKQLMDGFNALGGAKCDIQTPAVGQGENFQLKVQAAFAGGTPPDAWQTDHTWNPIWAAKGFSAALDDLMKRDKWDKAQVFPAALDTMQWQGKYYSMMQHPDAVFMWYATGLMEENGVDARALPTNWTQLDQVTIKLTKASGTGFDFVGIIPHIGADWAIVFPQANGAKLISDDGKKAQFDSPEVLAAVEWMKSHVKRMGGFEAIEQWRRTVPGGANATPGSATGSADIFAQKRMAAITGGNWYADNIRRFNKTNNTVLKFATAPIPSGPNGPRDHKANIYSGGILEAARKSGPKLDQTWDFFKYTASKEGGLNVQRNTADIAPNKEAARDPSIVNDPETGLGRKEAYPLFEQATGLARGFKHPAAVEIAAEYNKPINAYLRDQIGNLRDELKEANRLAQQRIDEFWAANPGAK